MPKKIISVKLDEPTIHIVEKYQQDHGNCDRTKAITDIINAHPLLKTKAEHHDLGKQIKENMPKESIMPDLCMYIDDLDLNRDAIHCSKKKAWVKADACKGCNDRKTSEGSLKNHG